MIRFGLALALLGACAHPHPIVTPGGTSADGETAWFAVTRGDELTIYRCEGRGCWVVPRADEAARRLPTGAPVRAEEPEVREPAREGPPQEERLDLMDGVL